MADTIFHPCLWKSKGVLSDFKRLINTLNLCISIDLLRTKYVSLRTAGILGCFAIAVSMISTGCAGSPIQSDYSQGKIYKFTRLMCVINTGDGYLLVEPGQAGTPRLIDDANPRGKGHYLRAIVRPGDRVMVRRLGRSVFNTVGPFIWVKSKMISGEGSGVDVDLGLVSFGDSRTTVYSDPGVLIAE